MWTKENALKAIDGRISGHRSSIHPKRSRFNTWGDDRHVPTIDKAKVLSEIARLEAARLNVEGWPDDS